MKQAWLSFRRISNEGTPEVHRYGAEVVVPVADSVVLRAAKDELVNGLTVLAGSAPQVVDTPTSARAIVMGTLGQSIIVDSLVGEATMDLEADGYIIRTVQDGDQKRLVVAGSSDVGTLYAAFRLLRLLQMGCAFDTLDIAESPKNGLRMINHWDNMDGSIERGYAGRSIFFDNQAIVSDFTRIREYARLLASVGINALTINNVNVHAQETKLITPELLPKVAEVAEVFRPYGIKLFLSVNYASPMEIGGLSTADPLDSSVKLWWAEAVATLYDHIPDFGGFVVKADSEFRPGPFTYGRNHVDGANLLAEPLKPFGGIVIWRCFVYNCLQDWRDRSTDRARAAFDHFTSLDGQFAENVVLQIKNGPMDFQVREPVSPLIGGLKHTNQMLELQITQEYTGQQRHLCYLLPQWKEVVDFDTYAAGEGSTVQKIVNGSLFHRPIGGFAAVSNIGNDTCWTGHPLAQANLYGYGRLAWDPGLSAESIAEEWVRLTFGNDGLVVDTIVDMLMKSWAIYEHYTAPLGVGWMVNPNHHYGPNVDGYEYSKWGTYHFADCFGIGVDRTMATGTGYTGQYHEPNRSLYESLEACPDELLLFFHHVSYQHRLKSGKTVIQHIYDTHFDGVEEAAWLRDRWMSLASRIDSEWYQSVRVRLDEQASHAQEWRDQINTYFFRKSGIPDEQSRTIY